MVHSKQKTTKKQYIIYSKFKSLNLPPQYKANVHKEHKNSQANINNNKLLSFFLFFLNHNNTNKTPSVFLNIIVKLN